MYSYIVIDDERSNRLELINKVSEIQQEMFTCIGEASNGADGLELVKEKSPDIVIIDMKMAKMDGIEFLARMTDSYPAIPIIVIIDSLKQKADILEKTAEGNEILKAVLGPWDGQAAKNSIHMSDGFFILVSVYTNSEDLWKQIYKEGSDYFQDCKCFYLENPAFRGQFFLVFLSVSETGIKRMETEIPGFFDCIHQRMKAEKLYVAVSRSFSGLLKLYGAYQKNEKMLQGIYLSDSYRIFYEASYENCSRRLFSDNELQDIMIELKYHSKRSNCLVEDFFGRFSIEKDTLLEIGDCCKRLLAKVNDWAAKNDVETEDIMSFFYRRYRFSESLEKMQKEISDYICTIYMLIQQKSFGDDYLYDQIMRYIRDNYDKKITLQTLADQFYISGAHCSNLLKRKSGRGLKPILTEIRINRAKELLDHTSMSVERISKEIGYPNPKYFFRMFKQMTALTPIEYRNRRK